MNVTPMVNALPTISVLLPVYNSQRYIRAAVESVLDQTFGDFELLALDGGSTDRSLSILRKYEARDRRVRVIAREKLALAPSLNEMIAIARGRYLARMDSDDVSRAKRFEKQVAYLEAHPSCVAVGSRSVITDPQGMPICEYLNVLTHEEIDSAHLLDLGGTQICHPAAMMRRDAVVQIGGYCEEYRYGEDLDLFLRLAEIGTLANLPEVLFERREHLKSICYSNINDVASYNRRAAIAARIRRGMPTLPEVSKSNLEPETNAELHRRWAWWALQAGYLATARKHAILTFAMNPLNIEALRVLGCAIRGY